MKIDALQVVSRTVIIGLATPGIRRLLSLCLAGLPMPGMSRCVDSFLGVERLGDRSAVTTAWCAAGPA